MHGVKRVENVEKDHYNPEDLKRIESYKTLTKQFYDLYTQNLKLDENWRDKMLHCSQELIISNPEYYTVWNERKRALKLFPSLSEDFIKKELMINVLAIRANPKSYGAWYHRRWFIENYCVDKKFEIANEELQLLSNLLDLDCRNFHGWNYRIWLTEWAEICIIDEFDFTTRKIYQNFSNYSAWQRRSQLLPKYLPIAFNSTEKIESFLRNEVEMCRNAAWTEPSDQSIWFYQRWLFGHLPELLEEASLKMLLTKTLALDQLKSMNELINEESRGFSVALAMSFIIFLNEKLNIQDNENIDYIMDLIKVDELRKGHWLNKKIRKE